ncbi:ubiquitin-like protein UBact [Candidatus Latescibacterota bacterium]
MSQDRFQMRDRAPRPPKPIEGPDDGGDDQGPRRPKVERPNTDDLLKRMRKVDPNQARRYRQRTGE